MGRSESRLFYKIDGAYAQLVLSGRISRQLTCPQGSAVAWALPPWPGSRVAARDYSLDAWGRARRLGQPAALVGWGLSTWAWSPRGLGLCWCGLGLHGEAWSLPPAGAWGLRWRRLTPAPDGGLGPALARIDACAGRGLHGACTAGRLCRRRLARPCGWGALPRPVSRASPSGDP